MKLGDSVNTHGYMDAFHVPSITVTADTDVRPGDSVMFKEGFAVVTLSHVPGRHGIVDPFRREPVILKGTAFWMMLEPALVGDKLTHQFRIELPKA